MKSSFSGAMPFISGAMALGAIALVGCGGGSSSQTPIPTATPNPNATATPVPTSTQGSTILFVSNRDGNNEIYSMRPDGTSQKRLTTAAAADNSPSRARNGSRIVFSSLRDGNPEIYTMGLAGETSQLQRLTTDNDPSKPEDTQPTFSSNGARIAWVSTRGGGANIWLMDASGANQTQFTTEGNISSPAFSPDGSEIAFSVVRPVSGTTGANANAVIVARKIATGTERILAQGAFSALAPRYSANGNQLIFTALTPGSAAQRLRLVNLASGAISDGPGPGNGADNFALSASFSPESDRLAFETAAAQSPQIGVSSGLGGAGVSVLTSQGSNFSPFWGQ